MSVFLFLILVIISWFIVGAITAYLAVFFRNITINNKCMTSSGYIGDVGEIRVVIFMGYISFVWYAIWTLKILVDIIFSGYVDYLDEKCKN